MKSDERPRTSSPGTSPADGGTSHVSPFLAFVLNLFFPGMIFWQFGARWTGGTILFVSLVGAPVLALVIDRPDVAPAVVLGLGLVTGVIAFVVHAREELRG